MRLGQITTRRQSVVEAHSMLNMYDRIKLLYPRSKRREQNTTKIRVHKSLISKVLKRSSKSKQNTAKVQVKNSNIAKDTLAKHNNCNKKSLGVSLKKVYILVSKIKLPQTNHKKPKVSLKTHRKLDLNSSNIETYKRKPSSIHLKLRPKTVKDFQNNDKLLADFNSGHSDDMFENRKAPSRVSQMNLDDSFSDVECSSDARSKTPVTNYVSSFGGWSQETPAGLRNEDEETSETPGQFQRCAFLLNAIREKKSKKLFPKSTVAKSSTTDGFNSCLSKLKPALEETEDFPSNTEDEMEPYFEDE